MSKYLCIKDYGNYKAGTVYELRRKFALTEGSAESIAIKLAAAVLKHSKKISDE